MRKLWVTGDRTFTIEVPDGVKCTFAPFSPPPSRNDRYGGQPAWEEGAKRGTLRIYKSEKDIYAVFSGVTMFYDMSLNYTEITDSKEIARGLAGIKEPEQDDEQDVDLTPIPIPIPVAKRRSRSNVKTPF